jgi:hypothetical protein
MNTKLFVSFTDFYNFVLQHKWAVPNNATVNNMCSKINEMNSQCACRRNTFLPQIENLYREIPISLNNVERASIKQALGVEEVQFANKGVTLLIF